MRSKSQLHDVISEVKALRLLRRLPDRTHHHMTSLISMRTYEFIFLASAPKIMCKSHFYTKERLKFV